MMPHDATAIAARVFVYGTLRRGEPNHRRLVRSSFVRVCQTEPRFVLVNLGSFPGMIAGGTTAIVGEVYDVDAATLARLDWLEGHPRFYERWPIRIEDGSIAEAYLLGAKYLEGRPIIESGDWRNPDPDRRV